ncbi:hypothetical protein TVAG_503170 [Trichomonas vaginalis G3]|uniref:Uncharacterized protein n=2 Tax=Trichomonas vaginalis (strain ATCC PRA-98 / G3) TaxID=412133 RepID=A2HU43_TRIV3|nr:hypothetical protein TVAG_503170 [Trichomonas vaginalis G3]|eukprot:XP_001280004.1 hypothetical protein [Trichomonas vaginalis G3]
MKFLSLVKISLSSTTSLTQNSRNYHYLSLLNTSTTGNIIPNEVPQSRQNFSLIYNKLNSKLKKLSLSLFA